MAKQNNNAGLARAGTDNPGGKDKGDTRNGEKIVTGSGNSDSSTDERTPKVGISKTNESGKGSGNR